MTEKEKYLEKAIDDFLQTAYSLSSIRQERIAFEKTFRVEIREIIKRLEKML